MSSCQLHALCAVTEIYHNLGPERAFLSLFPTSNMNLPVNTVVGQPAFSNVSCPTFRMVISELDSRVWH